MGAYYGIKLALFALAPSPLQQPQYIEIQKGQTLVQTAGKLRAVGALQSESDAEKNFILLTRVTRSAAGFKVGEYLLPIGSTPYDWLKIFKKGVSVGRPLTIKEGDNIYEISKNMHAKGFTAHPTAMLDLCKKPEFLLQLGFQAQALPPSCEGYLFPDTYQFTRAMTLPEMLLQMNARFKQVWTPEFETRAASLGMNRHQIITLASVIEKETGAPQERPLISSVFYNRLKKRMRLQSDPTTIYGIWERYKGNITRADLLFPTPFNTYTVSALPLGPIGNPGVESIKAALYPAESNYLFFVSHNDGTHQFSATLAEHNAAVKTFQIERSARQGKSWRDLSKRPKTGP